MQVAVALVLALVQLLMGSLAIVGRIVLKEIPPGFLVLVRVVGAAVVLFLVHRGCKHPRVRDRRDLRRFAGLGFLGISANQTLFLLGSPAHHGGERHDPGDDHPGLHGLGVADCPAGTTLGAQVRGHRLGRGRSGVLDRTGPPLRDPETALGNALILLGMLCYSLYLVHSKPLLQRHSPLTASYYVMVFGALGVLPYGLASLTQMPTISSRLWLLIGYIVLCPTILAYFLNIWALRRVSPNLVAVYIYLQPLFTAAISPLFLPGEQLTTRAFFAATAIFLGLALVILGERAQNRELPAEPMPGE